MVSHGVYQVTAPTGEPLPSGVLSGITRCLSGNSPDRGAGSFACLGYLLLVLDSFRWVINVSYMQGARVEKFL